MEYTTKNTTKRDWIAAQTFTAYAASKLIPLCQAFNFPEAVSTVEEVLNDITHPWGDRIIGKTPQWFSEITYDGTPMEISLALEDDQPEIRFLVEPQGESNTLISGWEVGCQINNLLENKYGISLERFRLVEDLFQPQHPQAGFSIGQAFCLQPGGLPEFKLYLSPLARGFKETPQLMEVALQRLGFAHAWDFLAEIIAHRGYKDQIVFFALDLANTRQARIKVYIANWQAAIADLEALLATSPAHLPGDAHRFCEAMLGSEQSLSVRPPLTCFAFTSDNDTRPANVTLHFPIRDYVDNDQEAMERICSFLTPQDRQIYEQTLSVIADRPLAAGVGLHTFVSFKRHKNQPRVTLYFSPEAYKVFPPRSLQTKVISK